MSSYHQPVMLREALELLSPRPDSVIVDGTLGGGGHTRGILTEMRRLAAEAGTCVGGRVLGIDQDPEAIAQATCELQSFPEFTALRGNFCEMTALLAAQGIESVDGILLDLGVSSHQLDQGERGFSFRFDAPLDMRMDTDHGITCEEFLRRTEVQELERVVREYGEERFAGRIARSINRLVQSGRPLTTGLLADAVSAAVPVQARYGRIHPATRTFQALRIAVNRELEVLQSGLEAALDLLKIGGVLAVMSYHSLEDRLVKNAFSSRLGKCTCPPRAPVCTCHPVRTLELITRKPLVASESEQRDNPRSRSAKFRAVRRISPQAFGS